MKLGLIISILIGVGITGCSKNSEMAKIILKDDSFYFKENHMRRGKNNTRKISDLKIENQCEIFILNEIIWPKKSGKPNSSILYSNGHKIANIKPGNYANFYVLPNSKNQFFFREDTKFIPDKRILDTTCKNGEDIFVKVGRANYTYTPTYKLLPFGAGISRSIKVSSEKGSFVIQKTVVYNLKQDTSKSTTLLLTYEE